ncbi:MAG: hypothetical protein QXE29_05670 [Candidatus Hadarchaeales archaeon]
MRLCRVECEILVFLYEYTRQFKTPIVSKDMVWKALVKEYCEKYREAAGADPLLFTKMFQSRERAVRRGLLKLKRAGLTGIVVMENDGDGAIGYVLSEGGLRVARQLVEEGVLEKDEVKRWLKARERLINRESEVRDALKSLWSKGYYAASLDEIYKELWENGKWRSREEFEAYWTKKRLARTLRRMNIKRVRRWNSGKVKILYVLPEP